MDDSTSPLNQVKQSHLRSRYFIVLAVGSQQPEALLHLFKRNQMNWVVVPDQAQVMFQLASEPESVVVIQPVQDPCVYRELFAAMHAYYPKSQCWFYQQTPEVGPQLVPLNSSHETTQVAMQTNEKNDELVDGQKLSLSASKQSQSPFDMLDPVERNQSVREGGLTDWLDKASSSLPSLPKQSALSSQELLMLLGDDFDSTQDKMG